MPISLFLNRVAMEDRTETRQIMLHRIRDFDWSESPAGPVESWPPDIRSVCRTMLLSTTPMAVLIGRDGAFVYNDAARSLIGDAYDGLLGKAVLDVFAGTDDFYRPVLARIFEGQSAGFRDLPFQLFRNGVYETVWFDLDYTPIAGENGEIYGALLIGNETTGRVRTLNDLRLSREKLDHALDASGIIGTWSVDFVTQTVYADDRFARLHDLDPARAQAGIPRSELLTHILPEDMPIVAAAFAEAALDGSYMCQHRVIGQAGVRWIVASGRISYLPDGAPGSFSGVAVDVTGQIETANALTESEARFRTYTDTLPHIVFSCNPDGRTTYVNGRWYEFTGHSDADAEPADWLTCVHPDDQKELLAAWRQALANGEPCLSIARHQHRSGEYRWARAVVLPIRNQTGVIASWIGTLTDIHESKLLEAEREAVSDELEHRIRNLFALVQGLIGITAREDHTLPSFIEQLRSRLTALHHAHGLIKSSQASPHEMTGSLLGLIAELLEPYDAGKKRTIISGDDVPVIPKAITWLALIFHELATNAAKYGAFNTAHGAIHVNATRDGEILRVIWKETGVPDATPGPERSGFGSRLLNMIIEGHLHGRLQRHAEPDGIKVILELPMGSFG